MESQSCQYKHAGVRQQVGHRKVCQPWPCTSNPPKENVVQVIPADQYPVMPEDDGSDRPVNPYAPHVTQ